MYMLCIVIYEKSNEIDCDKVCTIIITVDTNSVIMHNRKKLRV